MKEWHFKLIMQFFTLRIIKDILLIWIQTMIIDEFHDKKQVFSIWNRIYII